MCRASRPHFVNGHVEELGYIGQIRVAHQYRGRGLVSRGLSFLRELHADGRVRAYYGAISDENVRARGALVEYPGRHALVVRDVARIYTAGIILRRPKPPLPSDCQVSRASREELEAIAAFLRRHGAQKQFYPAYALDDFDGGATTLGFDVQDFVVARRTGEIVGVVGLWDQSGYKQSVVQSYNGYLRWLRPLYNLGAPLAGVRPLPARGEYIPSAYASFICVAEDDRRLFRVLLRQTYSLAAERGYGYLMLGLAEQDPLLPVAREYAHIDYHSKLYISCWEDAADFYEELDDRVPYIEIAAL
jgi:hypothetical protein